MASAGSSGRTNSKGFDFGSDDILCSYEDYQDSSNGGHSDPKDFHKTRVARSSVFPASSYSQPEDSFCQDVAVAIVEKSMKKHTDNVMRFLEGISSRLSQLELYCYNLDKSIGEMRSDLVRDHGEADTKLKSVEKHLQEVRRSVQILRDKQELADTQKELAKLQVVQKESSSSDHSQSSEEKGTVPASDQKKTDNPPEAHNQQLALALPHQVAPQQQPQPVPAPQAAPQNVAQQQPYYLPSTQLPTQPTQTQLPQGQYMPPDPQYRAAQMQDMSRVSPQPAQAQPGQQFAQYPQQWPQPLPQQVQPPPQQPSVPPQMRPPSTTVYPPYQPAGQPANSPPTETLPNSMPMQVPYSAVPQPLSSRADAMPYGYGAVRTVPQQPPPQQIKSNFGAQPGDGYTPSGSHPPLPPGSSYMMYDTEGGRPLHPPQQSHFPQGGYPSSSHSLQSSQPPAGANMIPRNPSPPQYMRSHPYGELIDKLVSMGFRGDHVLSVIQRMEESGQPIDFNAVLDRLSAHSSGGPQRGWSG